MTNLPYRGRKKRKKRKVAKRATKGISIDRRPEEANSREVFGHWEMDTIVSGGKGNAALLVLTERKTRFEIVEPLKNHSVEETIRALNRIKKDMGSLFSEVFKTITADNGTEFGNPHELCKALGGAGLYYCHPYCPHERGSNENNNKFIRRRIPKNRNLDRDGMTRKECYYLAEWINGYPRRLFGGGTARQRYNAELDAIEKKSK